MATLNGMLRAHEDVPAGGSGARGSGQGGAGGRPSATRRAHPGWRELRWLVPGLAVAVALVATAAVNAHALAAPAGPLLVAATGLAVFSGIALARRPTRSGVAPYATGATDARLVAAIEQGSTAVMTIDRAGVVRAASPSLARLLDASNTPAVGHPFLDRVDRSDRGRVAWLLAGGGHDRDGSPRVMEFRMLRGDFTPVEVEGTFVDLTDDPGFDGFLVTIRDVAERRIYEAELRRQAFRDPLTGLANRAAFFDRVESALERHLHTGSEVAVAYFDLDGFKLINDTLGHATGDRVLAIVGERMSWTVRGEDLVARLGGDEFAVLVEGEQGAGSVADIAERIRASIDAPIAVAGRQVRVGASVGIAMSGSLEIPSDPVSRLTTGIAQLADELVRDADVAMYESKRLGKDRVAFYEPTMRSARALRLDMETALRQAVEGDQFVVHYQPIVDLSGGRIVAVEALARWRRPDVGLVSPASFIGIAEETGLVRSMGAQLLAMACGAANAWSTYPGLELGVNLSPRQIQDPLVVGVVERALLASGFDPSRLVLEITESILVDDAPAALERLGRLRSMGIRLAIDDFGTGYSSLSYLEKLPVDILKIDRSFVVDLTTSPRRVALLRAIVAMARSLGLTTVAEGVETPAELALVRALGCDRAQGFYLAQPMGIEGCEALLAEDRAASGVFAPVVADSSSRGGRRRKSDRAAASAG